MEAVSHALKFSLPDLEGLNRRFLEEWDLVCGHFLEWERERLLLDTPTDQERADHRKALRYLLIVARALHALTLDPEFLGGAYAFSISGRLHQLEDSWEMLCNPMPAGEAAKLLRQVFPTEHALIDRVFADESRA